jgi:hypothetical protein
MAPQMLQNVLDRIRSATDWVLRIFLAFILRCLGVLLKAVFRAEDNSYNADGQARTQERKGEILQKRMSGAGQKKRARE